MDPELSADVKAAARGLEYWGQVAVEAMIGDTHFTTALFPKDGRYLLPVKAVVQRAEDVGEGDVVQVAMTLRLPGRVGRPAGPQAGCWRLDLAPGALARGIARLPTVGKS